MEKIMIGLINIIIKNQKKITINIILIWKKWIKKVKEVAIRYLNDGYGSINLLSVIGK